MAEIGNVTVRVDAVITDEQYREVMSAVSVANEYIAALEASNDELRMRNASLKAALEGMHLIREYDKAENDKLRQLVLEAHSCKTNEGCCEDCYCDECCCPIERRMQELGIEVDG